MYCPTCGAAAAAGAKFCTQCGGKIEAPNSAAAAASPPAPNVSPTRSEVPYAGFWRRFGGFVIDYVAVLFVIAFVAVIPLRVMPPSQQALRGWLAIAYLVLPWAYYAGMESSALQATLGKLAVGVKVTDLSGRRVSFLRATGRYFAHIVTALTLGVGYAMVEFTRLRQALHDKIAETLVVLRSRSPEQIAAAGPAPDVSGWATAGAIIGVMLFGPFGIGVLAAIAIPAYQDYTIRAQVADGLYAASAYKAAVTEAIAQGTPRSALTTEELGLSESSRSRYVDSVKIASGIIVVTYGGAAQKAIAGKTVLLIPGATADGQQIVWVCGHHAVPEGVTMVRSDLDLSSYTTVLDRNLPLECRTGTP
jgi:uncharacterized RDD family membrane protein YckC/Tfp pilus assembly major pilin PilA